MHGGRPYTAWWIRYPGRGNRAAILLARYASAIESKISYYERLWPGDVDWAPVIWDAAYRAAWRCDGPNFWELLKQSMHRKVGQYVKTHQRHAALLTRTHVDLDALPFRPEDEDNS